MGRKIEAQLNTGEPILFQTGSPFPRDWPLVVLAIAAFGGFLWLTYMVRIVPVDYLLHLVTIYPFAIFLFMHWEIYRKEAVLTDTRVLYTARAWQNGYADVFLSDIAAIYADGVRLVLVDKEGGHHPTGYVRDPEGLAEAVGARVGIQPSVVVTGKSKFWDRMLEGIPVVCLFLTLVLLAWCVVRLAEATPWYVFFPLVLGLCATFVYIAQSKLGKWLSGAVAALGLLITLGLMRLFLPLDDARRLMQGRRAIHQALSEEKDAAGDIPLKLARWFYGQRI